MSNLTKNALCLCEIGRYCFGLSEDQVLNHTDSGTLFDIMRILKEHDVLRQCVVIDPDFGDVVEICGIVGHVHSVKRG